MPQTAAMSRQAPRQRLQVLAAQVTAGEGPAGLKMWGADFSRSWRSHWMLRELGWEKDVEQVHVDINPNKGIYPGEPEKKEFYVKNLHPDARMPALEDTKAGVSIFESSSINLYLAKRSGGPLGPQNAAEDGQMTSWSVWLHGYCENPVIDMLFGSMRRDKAKRDQVVGDNFTKLKRPLAALNQYLEGKQYLVGGRFTVADLNVAAVLQWGLQVKEFSEELATNAPSVGAFLKRCCDRPTFRPVPAARFA